MNKVNFSADKKFTLTLLFSTCRQRRLNGWHEKPGVNKIEGRFEPHPIMWTPRPNDLCLSSEIESCRVAVGIVAFLTGDSALEGRLYPLSSLNVS